MHCFNCGRIFEKTVNEDYIPPVANLYAFKVNKETLEISYYICVECFSKRDLGVITPSYMVGKAFCLTMTDVKHLPRLYYGTRYVFFRTDEVRSIAMKKYTSPEGIKKRRQQLEVRRGLQKTINTLLKKYNKKVPRRQNISLCGIARHALSIGKTHEEIEKGFEAIVTHLF